ncbi:NeuD/PglB/VioB family sugar acetyltransferase [Altibacter sp. HG106]|uniref:NeuD/PglB/VioB family sugar acetyltransferase n=1 Tax=Altibacter sp. HG106 TaxID=3023937 RepID=UPI00234FF627|nr:NeuD/PglB/VioB family sugar acetyltransferase [Altibacter sp. HG106]MDC7995698.1 NeuD/PglB/VioB family sugar acetyltransferase [Altibacter sp. HG106]
MKKLAIIGAGDLGQLIAHMAKDAFEVVGYFDDTKNVGETIYNIPVLGSVAEIELQFQQETFDCLSVGIGYKHFGFRKMIFERFLNHIPFANVIHDSSFIDASCELGEGLVIFPGCVIDQYAQLGNNVLLNAGCTIAHHSRVKEHSFLSPRVALAGFVSVGSCCNLGINTSVIDNITIADYVQTGGGAVVIDSLKNSGLYVGVPAKFIK